MRYFFTSLQLDSQVLLNHCKEAYNYYYFQVRHDVLNNQISELRHFREEGKIVGLCFADMYREFVDGQKTIEELKENYSSYIPRELKKKHYIFIRRKIYKKLDSIKNKSVDAYYVRGVYLKDLQKMAPNYMTESYTAMTEYQESVRSSSRSEVRAHLEVSDARLKVTYTHKDNGLELPLEEVCNVEVDIGECRVYIQLKNEPVRTAYRFDAQSVLESFVSCLAGYYRLTISWTTNLCKELASPALQELKESKCHGPIGGFYAFKKLERVGNRPGCYILRECDQQFNTYYIDIVRKVKDREVQCEMGEPETFRIVRHDDTFSLYKDDGSVEKFDNLLALAKSIPIDSGKHERVAPSEFDKPQQLLLCLPPQLKPVAEQVSDLSELSNMQPRIIKFDSLIIFKGKLSGPLLVP